MNLLNEEIRVIQHTISPMKRGIALEPDQSKRVKMENDMNELSNILKDKLKQCEDFRG